MKSNKPRAGTDDSYLWMSYSDLMAGLFLSFILIFVAMQKSQEKEHESLVKIKKKIEKMTDMQKSQEIQNNSLIKIKKKIEKMTSLENGLEQEIVKIASTLNRKKTCINVKFEASGLTLKASSKASKNFWFESGSSDLLETGVDCLKEVSKFWIISLYRSDEYSSKIKQITIDGHTNSLAIKNSKSIFYDKDSFVSNMRLSQSRASNAAEIILRQTSKDRKIQKWLRTKITANGRSFGSLVYDETTGKEDLSKSIRVEFSVTLASLESENVDG